MDGFISENTPKYQHFLCFQYLFLNKLEIKKIKREISLLLQFLIVRLIPNVH